MRKKEANIRNRLIELIKLGGHKSNVSAQVQSEFKLSSPQLGRYLKRMEADGIIESSGYGKGKKYWLTSPALALQTECPRLRSYDLAVAREIGEDMIFQEFAAPLAATCSANVQALLRHSMTELINNALDHSFGQRLCLELYSENLLMHVVISDDGIGAFASIKKYFRLDHMFDAVAELTKGKRTTDRHRHAGEGIYFSQRMANDFSISANGIKYKYCQAAKDWTMAEISENPGTEVRYTIDQLATHNPRTIFQEYTNEDFKFVKSDSFTVLPYVLTVKNTMVSRSEAKKLMAGADAFEHVEIDFLNVPEIGQGFADEVFRVFQLQHPTLKITFRNGNRAVNAMISHVLAMR